MKSTILNCAHASRKQSSASHIAGFRTRARLDEMAPDHYCRTKIRAFVTQATTTIQAVLCSYCGRGHITAAAVMTED